MSLAATVFESFARAAKKARAKYRARVSANPIFTKPRLRIMRGSRSGSGRAAFARLALARRRR
jgi:hypothetical protein